MELFRVEGLWAAPVPDVAVSDGTAPDPILRGLDLTVGAGEIHAIMGPNGSGKSTLASTLMGSPEYEVTAGTISFRGDDITDWPADERAKAGLFLAFQYPQEIAGVSVIQFLRQALSARKGFDLSVLELRVAAMEWMQRLGMDSSFVDRYLNEGFSGGEKKRNEIMQLAILEPALAILDETDSGLDIDALRIVAKGIHEVRADRPDMGVVLITHYQRLLDELTPDHVHVLVDGRIVASGGMEIAEALEREGYEAFRPQERSVVTRATSTRPPSRSSSRCSPTPSTALPIHYLDSANSSQKPQSVIDAMTVFNEHAYAPINRSAYRLAAEATDAYEGARAKVARFVNAHAADEIVFTKNATEALNLVAQAWGRANLRTGDVVVLTHMEHHANVVPWHLLAAERGIELRWIPLTDDGRLDLTDLDQLVDGAKVVSVTRDEQRARHAQPGRRAVRRRPRHRRPGRRRRLPVRPAQPHRRAGVGRRLRRLLQPQDVRPVRHRRAVGTGRAARRHATLPRRRQHDRRRPPRRVHAGPGAGQVRGRHAADHRGHRLRRRRRLPRGAGHGRRAPARGRRSPPTPSPRSPRASATTSRSTDHATSSIAAACSASPSATSTPTTSARSSTSATSASGPATTAPSR